MPRASRHYIPGCIWHITHRCHKWEIFLKFGKDRRRWRHWLYETKKRYGLSVLNYIVTSNHIHLLVVDTKEGVIPKSPQGNLLPAGPDRNIIGVRIEKGPFGKDDERFRREHRQWVEMELEADTMKRKALWSESIAVGSEGFVSKIKEELGARTGRSAIISENEGPVLKEHEAPYRMLLGGEKRPLKLKNRYYLDISSEFTIG